MLAISAARSLLRTIGDRLLNPLSTKYDLAWAHDARRILVSRSPARPSGAFRLQILAVRTAGTLARGS